MKIQSKYFFCVVDAHGFVKIWYSSYFKSQAITDFLLGNGIHKSWKEAYKDGFRCKKFKIELINKV